MRPLPHLLTGASKWVASVFMPLWERETATGLWPWTDNGSMIETMLRLFVPGLVPMACGRQDRAAFEQCHMQKLLAAFGPTVETGARGGNGLRLVAPAQGWYGFGCTTLGERSPGTKVIPCTDSAHWWSGEASHSDYLNPGHKLGAKKATDFFTPPNTDGTLTGKVGSTFALHAKGHEGLPAGVRAKALSC